MKKTIAVILSYILVAALACGMTLWVAGPAKPPISTVIPSSGNQQNTQSQYSKLDELLDLIQQRYVDPVDATAVQDAAAAAMVEALGDRWSYYISAADYTAHMEQMNNAYVGIGITITAAEEGGFLVRVVNVGGSAEEAGMLVGDVIVEIDGQSALEMDMDQARDLVRGEEGTTVNITVLREGQRVALVIQRRQVQVPVATAELLEGNVGLVTIANFDARCADETIAAIEQLMAMGADKLIFDVRNNPGGYANEMVRVLDYLLPEGDLFRTVDYAGREAVDTSDAKCLDLPMVVLVNADSYSAAEFFAAALSEYEAAAVVGEHTSGKGYFQNTFRLSDGSAVGLSVGKYFTPKGVSLEMVGIQPDVEVIVDDATWVEIYYGTIANEDDPQLQAALELLLK